MGQREREAEGGQGGVRRSQHRKAVGGLGPGVSCGPPAPLPPSFPVPVLVEIEHEACNDEGDERHQDCGGHRAAVGSKVAADRFRV